VGTSESACGARKVRAAPQAPVGRPVICFAAYTELGGHQRSFGFVISTPLRSIATGLFAPLLEEPPRYMYPRSTCRIAIWCLRSNEAKQRSSGMKTGTREESMHMQGLDTLVHLFPHYWLWCYMGSYMVLLFARVRMWGALTHVKSGNYSP
jgi:hypothetical protein